MSLLSCVCGRGRHHQEMVEEMRKRPDVFGDDDRVNYPTFTVSASVAMKEALDVNRIFRRECLKLGGMKEEDMKGKMLTVARCHFHPNCLKYARNPMSAQAHEAPPRTPGNTLDPNDPGQQKKKRAPAMVKQVPRKFAKQWGCDYPSSKQHENKQDEKEMVIPIPNYDQSLLMPEILAREKAVRPTVEELTLSVEYYDEVTRILFEEETLADSTIKSLDKDECLWILNKQAGVNDKKDPRYFLVIRKDSEAWKRITALLISGGIIHNGIEPEQLGLIVYGLFNQHLHSDVNALGIESEEEHNRKVIAYNGHCSVLLSVSENAKVHLGIRKDYVEKFVAEDRCIIEGGAFDLTTCKRETILTGNGGDGCTQELISDHGFRFRSDIDHCGMGCTWVKRSNGSLARSMDQLRKEEADADAVIDLLRRRKGVPQISRLFVAIKPTSPDLQILHDGKIRDSSWLKPEVAAYSSEI